MAAEIAPRWCYGPMIGSRERLVAGGDRPAVYAAGPIQASWQGVLKCQGGKTTGPEASDIKALEIVLYASTSTTTAGSTAWSPEPASEHRPRTLPDSLVDVLVRAGARVLLARYDASRRHPVELDA